MTRMETFIHGGGTKPQQNSTSYPNALKTSTLPTSFLASILMENSH